MHFQPKKHFSAERKNGRFSVIPARTESVVILGHIFDGTDGFTKFRWKRSKFKGTYTSVGMARNSQKQGWAPKNDPLFGNETFLGGGPNGKVLAPDILVICPVNKNRDYYTKIDFSPQISKFRPWRPIGALPINFFNTKKVSHWIPDMRLPKVLLHPPKNLEFLPKIGQIWPQTGIFGQIWAFLAHLI